jgi:hypothetical protein
MGATGLSTCRETSSAPAFRRGSGPRSRSFSGQTGTAYVFVKISFRKRQGNAFPIEAGRPGKRATLSNQTPNFDFCYPSSAISASWMRQRVRNTCTVACNAGFTFTTGTKVLLRHIEQGLFVHSNHIRSSVQCVRRPTVLKSDHFSGFPID